MKRFLGRPAYTETVQSGSKKLPYFGAPIRPPPLWTGILRMKDPNAITTSFESVCHVLKEAFHSSQSMDWSRRKDEDLVPQGCQLPRTRRGRASSFRGWRRRPMVCLAFKTAAAKPQMRM
jgi:hypothetical protein